MILYKFSPSFASSFALFYHILHLTSFLHPLTFSRMSMLSSKCLHRLRLFLRVKIFLYHCSNSLSYLMENKLQCLTKAIKNILYNKTQPFRLNEQPTGSMGKHIKQVTNPFTVCRLYDGCRFLAKPHEHWRPQNIHQCGSEDEKYIQRLLIRETPRACTAQAEKVYLLPLRTSAFVLSRFKLFFFFNFQSLVRPPENTHLCMRISSTVHAHWYIVSGLIRCLIYCECVL